MEDEMIALVDFFVAINNAGKSDFKGRFLAGKQASLDRGTLGAQKDMRFVYINAVLHQSGWVLRGDIEALEAKLVGFDFRTVVGGETQGSK